ncbi:hypothetical protein Nepgr_022753 [Nepenthes gracilis]|uniref:Uncharacterized protein n=1 Tax=Nepenthes gracilis TaxID=150966 RepID=A0AAD3XYQ5_NEPGR|nr:hypothetical protein Nepgr_022753 [Nepenthes gracilis]
MSPRQDLFTGNGHVFASVGDLCASDGGFQLATSLMPSATSLVDDGQEFGDADQILPAAEPLSDSHLLPSNLFPADEVCKIVYSPIVDTIAGASDELKACLGQIDPTLEPCMLSADYETQPLGVACTESHEMLVSFPLTVSRAGPKLMKPIHLEGKHRPVCDAAASDSVPPGMQTDEVVKESPSVDSSPSHGEPEQAIVEDLEEAPASRSPPAAVVSLNLDDAGCVVNSHVGKHPKVVSGESLSGWPDPGSEPEVSASVGEGRPRDILLGALVRGSNGCAGIPVDEAGQTSNFDLHDDLDPDVLFPL